MTSILTMIAKLIRVMEALAEEQRETNKILRRIANVAGVEGNESNISTSEKRTGEGA